MRLIFSLSFLTFLAVNSHAQVIAHDGSKYNTVKIGDTEWLSSNLNVSTFNNGTQILKATSLIDWNKAYNEKRPVYCYLHFQDSNAVKFGALYNWFAVISPAKLAPSGWHIPNSAEWNTLVTALGGEIKTACFKLKAKKGWGWGQNTSGNNSSGFGAVPAGSLYENGTSAANYFINFGMSTTYWSTTDRPQGLPDGFLIVNDWNLQGVSPVSRQSGYSVRCIKDK